MPGCDSVAARSVRGEPWLPLLPFAPISTPRLCARWPNNRGIPIRPGAFWRWPRSMRASRTEAARIGGVTVQIVRDWVVKFNAHGPAGWSTASPRATAILTDAHRAALQAIVDQGPIPAIHGVVRWRLIDLIAWLWEEFRITISKQTLSRELRAMNYRKLSARPRHHAKNEAAVSAFKKTSPPVWRRSGRRSAASRSRSGSPMRPGSGRRTRSRDAGPNAARARPPPRTKGPPRPTSSGPSARLRAKARAWFCPAARPRA